MHPAADSAEITDHHESDSARGSRENPFGGRYLRVRCPQGRFTGREGRSILNNNVPICTSKTSSWRRFKSHKVYRNENGWIVSRIKYEKKGEKKKGDKGNKGVSPAVARTVWLSIKIYAPSSSVHCGARASGPKRTFVGTGRPRTLQPIAVIKLSIANINPQRKPAGRLRSNVMYRATPPGERARAQWPRDIILYIDFTTRAFLFIISIFSFFFSFALTAKPFQIANCQTTRSVQIRRQ